jgi:hypothetical protein
MTKVVVINQGNAQVIAEPNTGIQVHAYQRGPAGASGADSFVLNEVPTGLVNGSNVTFTTAFNFVPGSEQVFLNGIKLTLLQDYNTSGNNTITLYQSPLTGELIQVNYTKS